MAWSWSSMAVKAMAVVVPAKSSVAGVLVLPGGAPPFRAAVGHGPATQNVPRPVSRGKRCQTGEGLVTKAGDGVAPTMDERQAMWAAWMSEGVPVGATDGTLWTDAHWTETPAPPEALLTQVLAAAGSGTSAGGRAQRRPRGGGRAASGARAAGTATAATLASDPGTCMMERRLPGKFEWTELPAVLAEGLLRLHGAGVELSEPVFSSDDTGTFTS